MRQVRGGPEQEVAAAGGKVWAQQVPRLPVRGAGGRAQEAVRLLSLGAFNALHT